MENKKIELGVFAAENRKRAADFLNKTTNKVKTALDQNDDGELNLKDASIIAETLNASVKGTVAVIKDIAQTKNRELEFSQKIWTARISCCQSLSALPRWTKDVQKAKFAKVLWAISRKKKI